MTIIRSLVRKASKQQGPCKAYSLFWDGGFDLDITKSNLKLWGTPEITMRGWEPMSTTCTDNVEFIDAKFSSVGHDLEFDMVLCNDRFKQFDAAKKIASRLHVPVVFIDHMIPKDINPIDLAVLKEGARKGIVSIACHETIAKGWDSEFTIPYGVDIPEVDLDEPRIHNIVIHGSFQQLNPTHRDLIARITNDTDALLFGYNQDKSNPFTSWEQCSNTLKSAQVFINLSTSYTIPRGLLLAMAHGCAVITNNIAPLNSFLSNRNNCLVIENLEDILPASQELLKNNTLRYKLGQNARDTIQEVFPMDAFVTNWTETLDSLREVLYLP